MRIKDRAKELGEWADEKVAELVKAVNAVEKRRDAVDSKGRDIEQAIRLLAEEVGIYHII